MALTGDAKRAFEKLQERRKKRRNTSSSSSSRSVANRYAGKKSYTDQFGVVRYEGTTGYKEVDYIRSRSSSAPKLATVQVSNNSSSNNIQVKSVPAEQEKEKVVTSSLLGKRVQQIIPQVKDIDRRSRLEKFADFIKKKDKELENKKLSQQEKLEKSRKARKEFIRRAPKNLRKDLIAADIAIRSGEIGFGVVKGLTYDFGQSLAQAATKGTFLTRAALDNIKAKSGKKFFKELVTGPAAVEAADQLAVVKRNNISGKLEANPKAIANIVAAAALAGVSIVAAKGTPKLSTKQVDKIKLTKQKPPKSPTIIVEKGTGKTALVNANGKVIRLSNKKTTISNIRAELKIKKRTIGSKKLGKIKRKAIVAKEKAKVKLQKQKLAKERTLLRAEQKKLKVKESKKAVRKQKRKAIIRSEKVRQKLAKENLAKERATLRAEQKTKTRANRPKKLRKETRKQILAKNKAEQLVNKRLLEKERALLRESQKASKKRVSSKAKRKIERKKIIQREKIKQLEIQKKLADERKILRLIQNDKKAKFIKPKQLRKLKRKEIRQRQVAENIENQLKMARERARLKIERSKPDIVIIKKGNRNIQINKKSGLVKEYSVKKVGGQKLQKEVLVRKAQIPKSELKAKMTRQEVLKLQRKARRLKLKNLGKVQKAEKAKLSDALLLKRKKARSRLERKRRLSKSIEEKRKSPDSDVKLIFRKKSRVRLVRRKRLNTVAKDNSIRSKANNLLKRRKDARVKPKRTIRLKGSIAKKLLKNAQLANLVGGKSKIDVSYISGNKVDNINALKNDTVVSLEVPTKQDQNNISKTDIKQIINTVTRKSIKRIPERKSPLSSRSIKRNSTKKVEKKTIKRPLKYDIDKKSKRKSDNKSSKAYVGYVKSRGKFVKVTGRLTKNRAYKKAADLADNSTAQSIKGVQSGKIPKSVDIKRPNILSKFRRSKRNSLILVEKKKYAIDSRGEKMGITLKGLMAKRKSSKKAKIRRNKAGKRKASKTTSRVKKRQKGGLFGV